MNDKNINIRKDWNIKIKNCTINKMKSMFKNLLIKVSLKIGRADITNSGTCAILKKAREVEHLAFTYLHTAGVQGQQKKGYNHPRIGVTDGTIVNSAIIFLQPQVRSKFDNILKEALS